MIEQIRSLLETYSFGLPTGVVAVILLIVGLKLKKAVFKLIGFALIAAAVLFFLLKM